MFHVSYCYCKVTSLYTDTAVVSLENTAQLKEVYEWQFPEDLECDRVEAAW